MEIYLKIKLKSVKFIREFFVENCFKPERNVCYETDERKNKRPFDVLELPFLPYLFEYDVES